MVLGLSLDPRLGLLTSGEQEPVQGGIPKDTGAGWVPPQSGSYCYEQGVMGVGLSFHTGVTTGVQ